MTPKRVAIYYRVSTDDQHVENQMLDLRKFCADRQWSIVAERMDEGISSVKKREKLEEIMDLANRRKIDVLLVWHYDRFARSTIHLITTLERLENLGVDFISYQQGFMDTTTPQGRLLFEINAAYAQFERRMIVDRTKSGLRRAVANGKKLGRPMLPESKVTQVKDLVAANPHWSWSQVGQACGLNKSVAWKIGNRFKIPPPSVELLPV